MTSDRSEIQALAAPAPEAAAQAVGVRVWQPMDTAPKNGTGILALLPDSNFPVGIRYEEIAGGRWCVAWDNSPLGDFDQPRLWMRIPDEDATALPIARADALAAELRALYKHYVNTLESARDQIIARGGECDPVDIMEKRDPVLKRVREALEDHLLASAQHGVVAWSNDAGNHMAMSLEAYDQLMRHPVIVKLATGDS